jgi:hypothetical protein
LAVYEWLLTASEDFTILWLCLLLPTVFWAKSRRVMGTALYWIGILFGVTFWVFCIVGVYVTWATVAVVIGSILGLPVMLMALVCFAIHWNGGALLNWFILLASCLLLCNVGLWMSKPCRG